MRIIFRRRKTNQALNFFISEARSAFKVCAIYIGLNAKIFKLFHAAYEIRGGVGGLMGDFARAAPFRGGRGI